LLVVGVRSLPPARAHLGRAMLAELDHIEGRWARLGFALGCVRAASWPSARGRETSL